MSRPVIHVLLTIFFSAVLAAPAFAGQAHQSGQSEEPPVAVVDGPGVLLSSTGSAQLMAARETAGPDTFAIYGGPDHPTEGKFQMGDGSIPDWGGGNGLPGGDYGGGSDAWMPVDLTKHQAFWHVDTFNAANLNGNGSGNHAIWSGLDGNDPISETWTTPPGYGNGWNDILIYESAPLADPSVGETAALDFFFNHDSEPGYDYFIVEYDSAGSWTEVFLVDSSNKDGSNVFQPPGEQYSLQSAKPINWSGNDFGGDNLDRIRIRFRATSDGAWSDEDGLWPSDAGLVQVDDISLTTSQGSLFEDFEGVAPFLFSPQSAPFAGDFAQVHPRLSSIDPCRSNLTPLVGFMDYDQIVRNGPSADGLTTRTGGSISAGIDYGIVGNWVNNYTGGLSFGEVSVANEVWSPAISWDLPGASDDDVGIAGAMLRFDVWEHLILTNGYFWVWHVRSGLAGEPWGNWQDRNFVHYSPEARWTNRVQEVSDLMQAGPERVQIALGTVDMAAVFGFPGQAAAPSPAFDNVAFYKYRIAGPSMVTRNIDLANDGFPVSGSIDASTQGSRGGLDVPFDMARDINTGDFTLTPGDSITVDVTSNIPAATVTDIRMIWALDTNPLFEDSIRSAPSRAKDQSVIAGAAGTVWTGEVVADTSTTSAGHIIQDRYFLDLPDADFMYPGDVLHYYIQATDSDGRVSMLPNDTSGFGVFGNWGVGANYNRAFTMRCLPSVTDASGAQPEILVWNDFGRRGGEAEWLSAFHQLGYPEGTHFDSYTTQGPSSAVSNGLGSPGGHGATAGQLSGYEHIFYFSGNLASNLISDGEPYSWSSSKANDVDLLEQWHALPGTRNSAYFGDNVASGTSESNGGLGYVTGTMGVEVLGNDVRGVIGNQVAPVVAPNTSGSYAASFATSYTAYGGCLQTNVFDEIRPLAGAEAGHYFIDSDGQPISGPSSPVASVVNPVANGLVVTIPTGSLYIRDVMNRSAVGLSARTLLFEEILGLFNAPPGGTATGNPASAGRGVTMNIAPNPFNPSTVVSFTGVIGKRGTVKVYNLRGELIRTLHSGEFTVEEFRWDGTDERGRAVASGVYVVKATGPATHTAKVALVK